ncbi:cysteinyl leukotriene receptor 1 [Bactrocera dorsalis]|uniref:Cysteinyl leukotriene receptor 1 n=1 Tax=Bactrocera dorsalis TaxID=27457 RepID=A0ABM3JZK5_BACDO|nr:cysteinyl leukotriene receptor 1 [Bactrocera dorsalis]
MPPIDTRAGWPVPTTASVETTPTATLTATPAPCTYVFHNDQQLLRQQQQQQLQVDTSSLAEQLFNDTLLLLDNSDDINATNFTFDPLNNNNSSSNITLYDLDESSGILYFLAQLTITTHYYYVPALVIAGTIGNILSVFVFSTTKLRKLSSSIYLAALAISDTCFLWGLAVQWMNFLDVDVYNRDFFCQFFTFLSNWACFCSAWFVVAFTVERFIAVAFPLKRQTMCTVHRAKYVIGALSALGIFHCVPFYFSSAPIYSQKMKAFLCDVHSEMKNFMAYMNFYDTVVVFVLPFASIVILNAITSYRVWKFANVRRSLTMHKRKVSKDSLMSSTYLTASLKNQNNSTIRTEIELPVCKRKTEKQKDRTSSQLKVTKMLLIVSSVFVGLNLPSCLMRIETYWETQTSSNKNVTIIWQYVFQLLFITNYGINFILYCVSGQNFR